LYIIFDLITPLPKDGMGDEHAEYPGADSSAGWCHRFDGRQHCRNRDLSAKQKDERTALYPFPKRQGRLFLDREGIGKANTSSYL